MKKIILKSILFIGIGFLLGNLIFNNNKDFFLKMKSTDTYYFLQEGVYLDYDHLQNNISKLSEKTIEKKQDKYYVYVGITKDKEVAELLKNIYEKKGYKIYQKERNISSREFSENVNQFDWLIKETEEEEQILTIEKIVLANYEEISKKSTKE